MADHVRKQIRDALSGTLSGLATTGANVFTSRVYPIEESSLPCLVISTPSESLSLEDGTLDAPQRILTVEVRGMAKAVTSIDDDLDQIAKEVETAAGADITVGGLSHGLDLIATESSLTDDGDQPHGNILLTYNVLYRTPFGDPSTVA